MSQRPRIRSRRFRVDAKLRVHLRQKLRGVPLIGMLFARAECIDQLNRHIFRNAQHVIALVLTLQRRAPNPINGFALLVHHIVVFQQMFARIEVLRLHGLLRAFDLSRNQPGLNRHAFRHSQPEHQRLHALAAENAHQVVFQRKKNRDEPGSPWRPARPRSWLSMRRASCRSVPRMCKPPSATTSSCSALHCSANWS